jgi:serine/threonine-protein kinase
VLAGRYVLQDELGVSGSGASWRATDTVLDRQVVVKLLHRELVLDPTFEERLGQELRMVALVSHRGLARLLDTGRDDGIAFIVREHVEGESVRERLDRDGEMPPATAARIARSLLETIAAAHDAGVLHLDLKPENVIVSSDGSVRLCDLGVGEAVVRTRGPHEASQVLGPVPLAPELWSGNGPDARTDVWGAGALLFEMLTRRAPAGAHTSPREHRTDVPRRVDDLVVRALSADPEDRFRSAEKFATDLDAVLGTAAGQAGRAAPAGRAFRSEGRTLPAPPAPHHSVFRTWLMVPLLVMLLAAGTVGAGLWVGRLELGGPVGITFRDGGSSPAPASHVVPFVSVAAFDPYADGHENDSGLPLAADGRASTAWKSENYFDGRLNKPGVGLLFDLGGQRTIDGFRLQTPYPGFRFAVLVGDDPSTMISDVTAPFTSSTDMREAIGPVTGRYVLLWITSVVATDDGNRAEVGEFRVTGPA